MHACNDGNKNAIKLLRSRKGRLATIAAKLGLTKQAVYFWPRVPDRHVREVAKITGIPLSTLRPDLYGGQKSQSNGKQPR